MGGSARKLIQHTGKQIDWCLSSLAYNCRVDRHFFYQCLQIQLEGMAFTQKAGQPEVESRANIHNLKTRTFHHEKFKIYRGTIVCATKQRETGAAASEIFPRRRFGEATFLQLEKAVAHQLERQEMANDTTLKMIAPIPIQRNEPSFIK